MARGDYERAMVIARLERDPAKRCDVLLGRAAALQSRDLTAAKNVLDEARQFVRRYANFPETATWRKNADARVSRQLSEIAVTEAAGPEALVAAVETLLGHLEGQPQQRAAVAVDAAIRLDAWARRDLAGRYHEQASREDGDSSITRSASLAKNLLDGAVDELSIESIDALLTTLAESNDERLLGYLLALLVERAWQEGNEMLPAQAVETWKDRYSERLAGEVSTASRHRLAVHTVILDRFLRKDDQLDTAKERDAAKERVSAAHRWLAANNMPRDAADAALVAASLSRRRDDRDDWLAKANTGYGRLVDRKAGDWGLQEVDALGPRVSTTLAAQFEAGDAQFHPAIEDEAGFGVRVRAAYEAQTRQAFDRGNFAQAFQNAQKAKLAELGIKVSHGDEIGFDKLVDRFALDPENMQGPNVDLLAEYLVTDRATYLFALRADAKRQVFERISKRIDVDRQTLRRRILDFIGALDVPAPAVGRALFDLLLEPVWGDWPGPWVVIAPDGPLRFLPVELLPVTDGKTLLMQVTAQPEAVLANLEKRAGVLRGERRLDRRIIDRVRKIGIWPLCGGRVSYLPTVAVLAKEDQATRDVAMKLWSRSAARMRHETLSDRPMLDRLGATAPLGGHTFNGFVLSLWSEPESSALLSASGRYVHGVFTSGSGDYGGNNHGQMLGQLRRDLVEGYRVEKQGRDARAIPLAEPISPADWGRWIYVDLAPVSRTR
jgi:hypothetical protein